MSILHKRIIYRTELFSLKICRKFFLFFEDVSIYLNKAANYCARRSVNKEKLKSVDKKVMGKLLGADIVDKNEIDIDSNKEESELKDELKEARIIVVRLHKALSKVHKHYVKNETAELDYIFKTLGFEYKSVAVNNEFKKVD